MRTIDAVTAKLSGGDFVLLCDNAAIVRLEETHGIEIDQVGSIIFSDKVKLRKLCEVASVFVNQDGVTADTMLQAAPTPEDLVELGGAISRAMVNYFPPKKANDGEGGGAADDTAGRPFASES